MIDGEYFYILSCVSRGSLNILGYFFLKQSVWNTARTNEKTEQQGLMLHPMIKNQSEDIFSGIFRLTVSTGCYGVEHDAYMMIVGTRGGFSGLIADVSCFQLMDLSCVIFFWQSVRCQKYMKNVGSLTQQMNDLIVVYDVLNVQIYTCIILVTYSSSGSEILIMLGAQVVLAFQNLRIIVVSFYISTACLGVTKERAKEILKRNHTLNLFLLCTHNHIGSSWYMTFWIKTAFSAQCSYLVLLCLFNPSKRRSLCL